MSSRISRDEEQSRSIECSIEGSDDGSCRLVARRHQGRPPSKCAPPRRWTKARHIAIPGPSCAAAALSTVHYPSEILPTMTGFTYVSLLDAPAPPATRLVTQTKVPSPRP